ncbi:MAG: glycerophosphoryl diester phosphodiesterase [Solirubrobacteraceae bacterium]|jgi:glycerophosphoryl diester phosphodiesterase|nr:glycerophosphoryl diester phosphodiesterase [Solirubrobacteraceae bacterium]
MSERRVKRIGHGGAGAVVRGNTLASFDAAVEIGVDMIEFDVRASQGHLVLAHGPIDAFLRQCPTLDQALAHLRQPRFSDLELNVDVKTAGCEAAVLDALHRHGVADRALVSSRIVRVLDRIKRLDPPVQTGISIGALARRPRHWGDVLDGLAGGRFDALMANHRLVGKALVDAVRERGCDIYCWTVDSRPLLARLESLEVSGITTNDPRLFVV